MSKVESIFIYTHSGRQPPKCKNVVNVDIFNFDLTCDVIGHLKVIKTLCFRKKYDRPINLTSTVKIQKFDPDVSEVGGREGAQPVAL